MVNDSAGTDVILVDKSQRPAAGEGFKAAVAIETERGLCNKPTLITSTDDFVKVFGNPAFDKYGQANLEAYFLAQNNVPLVISRAKNPSIEPGDSLFGCMRVSIQNGKLFIDPNANANAISTPADKNTALLFFKGEGNYCSKKIGEGNDVANYSDIVLRFSEPQTRSAYAEARRTFQIQVYDFAGARHIDTNTPGTLALTPGLDPVLGGGTSGKGDALSLDGYALDFEGVEGDDFGGKVIAFVNGVRGEADYAGESVYEAIAAAVLDSGEIESFMHNGDGTFTVPAGVKDCFNLSISISISATARGIVEQLGATARTAYRNYGCGSVSITPEQISGEDEPVTAIVEFTLSTGLYLKNRRDYMYMGTESATWAGIYSSYLKETFITSFSYDDYDASGISMQLDSALAGSNYLVGRTSEVFEDYSIDFESDVNQNAEDAPAEASAFIKAPQYFDGAGELKGNEIDPGQRSYAYSLALRQIAGSNLTTYRCVVTPNLADAMNVPDFQGAIAAFGETTLGASNIGKAASLSAFENLSGRHGNRFITDFSQYGRRTVAGRRTWLTLAALVTLTLNNNFKNNNEARPPMGLAYGQLECEELSQEFTGPQRKVLAQTHKLNPAIAEGGFFLWEETTSQLTDTALSDTHNILSYCWMKYMLYQAMRPFVAEYNDVPTINEGLRVLKSLNQTFIDRNYIEEGRPNADKNVIGDKVMRFDFPVRFKGVGRYVDIYVTAYPQTQSLEISLAEES